MTTEDVVLRPVAPVRVAELTAAAASYSPQDTGPVFRRLRAELLRRLPAAGAGPVIAYYQDPAEPSDAVTVHAAIPLAAGQHPGRGLAVVQLPAIGSAATVLHRGPMVQVIQSLLAVAGWIEDNGYRPAGWHREVYLEYDPDSPGCGVTELQVPVTRDHDRELARITMPARHLGTSGSDRPVDSLAQQVGMAVVPGVLVNQVQHH